MKYPLDLACTLARHKELGAHAAVNARAGEQWRNYQSQDETEQKRDAQKIRARIAERVRFYQFNSRFFRRHAGRLSHLLSRSDD